VQGCFHKNGCRTGFGVGLEWTGQLGVIDTGKKASGSDRVGGDLVVREKLGNRGKDGQADLLQRFLILEGNY